MKKADRIKYDGDWIVNIHEKVLRNRNLSIQAKGLYAILLSFCNKNMEAFPSLEYLSDLSKLSRGSVIKYMRELENSGYMEKEKVRREDGLFSHNIYKMRQNNQVQNLNMEKQTKNPSPFYQRGKLDSSINQLNSILFSIAHSLVEELETDKNGHSIQLIKIINKYKKLLGEAVLRETTAFLFAKGKTFQYPQELAKYLQAVLNNGKGQHTEVSETEWK